MRRFFSKTQFFILGLLISASSLNAQNAGNCLAFDGYSQYVQIPRPPTVQDDFTIECWINTTQSYTTGAANWYGGAGLIDGDGGGANCDFGLSVNAGKICFGTGPTDYAITSPLKYNDGNWHHVAVTRTKTSGQLLMYVDGVQVASGIGNATAILNTPTNLSIGKIFTSSSYGAQYFNGKIDEIRFWSTARTLAEIQANMYKELAGTETGLQSYYKCNLTEGAVLTDQTANLRNGTLTNSPLWTSSEALCPIVNAATGVSNVGFTASWLAVANATAYKIDVSDKSDFSNLLKNNVDCGTSTNKTFSDLSLVPGTIYYYRLRSVVGAVTSANSKSVSFILSPGNAIALDGIDDFITVPQISTGWNDLTIETWINLSQQQLSSGFGIYNTNGWSAGCAHFQITENSIGLSVNGNSADVYAYFTFTPNTWYHVATTYSATGKLSSVYINGNLVKSAVQTSTQAINLYDACIGCWHNPGVSINRWFNGKMDEYRIWNKVKTQAEIQADMYKELTGSEAGLRLYYNFNKGNGGANNSGLTTISDLATVNAASPINGTLTNSTLNGTTSNYVISGAFAPTVFDASNISSTGFTANWAAVSGLTISSYRVDVSDRSDFGNLLASNVNAGTGTSFIITGLSLTKGSNYYYRVRYETAAGYSNYSATKSFVLDAGNAMAMDGSNDFMRVYSSPSWNMSKVTLEAWVYCNTNVINVPQFIMSKGVEKFEIHIGTAVGNNTLRFIPTTGVWLDAPVNSLMPGKWNHVACSFDPSNSANNKIYINGTSVTVSKAGSGAVTTALVYDATDFLLGARTNVGNHLGGKLDEVRVWNTIRSQSEVTANMYASLSGTETGLVAYYNFNQGNANLTNTGLLTIPDLSPNGNVGTLFNCALVDTTSNYVTSRAFDILKAATNITTTGFTANWNPVPAATGFLIDVDDDADFSSPLSSGISVAAGNTSSAVPVSLVAGKNYYYRMRYTTASGTSDYTDAKTFAPTLGNALSFESNATYPTDATKNDYVNLGTVSPSGNFTTGFTFMGWVKWDAFNSWARLFDLGTGQAYNTILLANYGTTGNLQFDMYDNSQNGIGSLKTSVAVPLNQWVHIAATITGNGVGVIYLNGQSIATGKIGIPSNFARNLCYLGRSNWSTDSYFKGSMDEISFWTRALNPSEINAYMNTSLSGSESGLYLYYKFDQGTAEGTNTSITTLTDAMGHNHGTLTNFAMTGTTGNFVSPGVVISTTQAPVIYNATNISTTGFKANWKKVSAATKYRIDVSDKLDFSNLLVKNADAGTDTTFTLSGLNLKQGTYFYRMRYESASGTSVNSNVQSFLLGSNNCLYLNGADDGVSIPQLATGLDEVTFETWLNCDAINGYLHGIYNTNAWTTGAVHFQFSTSNKLALSINGNSPEAQEFSYTFTSGQWYHVAYTYKASTKTVNMYVNGALVNTGTYTTAIPINLTAATMGDYPAAHRFFNGKFDNYRIWKKVRTMTELQASRNSDVVGNEANLLLSYNFNQGTPNTDNSLLRSIPDACGSNYGYSSDISFTGAISNYVVSSMSRNVFYVNAAAATGGNGLSPATAFNNLPAAFAAATGLDTIKVAEGTYYQPSYNVSYVPLGKSLTLVGGYNSSFTARDTVNRLSVLSGVAGATTSILNFIDCNLSIDGFSLQNGVGSTATVEGGAIHFYSKTGFYNLNISNCNFINNRTTTGWGGAVWIYAESAYQAATATIRNSTFKGNYAAGYGGAISNFYETTRISNCIFDGNTASNGAGGAIHKSYGLYTISGSTFINNKSLGSGWGGALSLFALTDTLKNNTFYNNISSQSAGAIWTGDNSSYPTTTITTLINNTIVGNFSSSNLYTGGIECQYGTLNLMGNIIAGNSSNYTAMYDLWQNSNGYVVDKGYNIFGTNASNGLTFSPTTNVIPNEQLYNILESTNQTNKSARLFPARVTDNGGATPTNMVIGRYFKNNSATVCNMQSVPASVNSITMPTTDQRGLTRISGKATIGAVELDKYIYVNANAAAGGNGTIKKPYNNLAQALKAYAASDTFMVAAGTYQAPDTSFRINKTTTLIGGYNSAFTINNPADNKSSIEYLSGSSPLVYVYNANVEIKGFTFYNAQSTGLGGGLLVKVDDNKAYSVNVNNCIFEKNNATSGAGICLSEGSSSPMLSTVTISNCTFTGNSASSFGGAVYANGLFNSQIKNSTITGNTAVTDGGAIYQHLLGSMLILQNTIIGNKCNSLTAGGGLTCNTSGSGSVNLLGNILAGNKSGVGLHDLYKKSGTLTDKGYNIVGTLGANVSKNATTDSLATTEMYFLLESDTVNVIGHIGTFKADRQFFAKIANNGGYTTTIRLKKRLFYNIQSLQKHVNVIPGLVVNGISLDSKDQRGVVRVATESCIGTFEYRDTVQTSNIATTSITANTANIHFAPGSFSARVVFMKNANTATTEIPVNGTSYSADDEFGKGTQLGASSGWYCVYNGSDTSFTVTGLNPVDTFAVKAFEFNDISYYYTSLTGVSNNPKTIVTPKMTQSISLVIPAKTWGDVDFALNGASSLGLAGVYYTSSVPAVATIVNNIVHITGVGTTQITAKHDGNNLVSPAPNVIKSLTVTADTLFVTATNTTSKYGEVPAFSFTTSGLKNNDSIIVQVGVTYTSAASDSSNVGNYDVTPSSVVFGRGVVSNYILAYNKGVHNIAPASLTIKADDKTKVFGTANPPFTTAQPANLKNSNVIEVNTYNTLCADLSPVGTYDIMPSNATFTKGSAANYNVVYAKGILSVTPAPVTIKTADTSKVYGTANPAFKLVVTGLKSTDAISNAVFTTSANDSSAVGSYPITPSGSAFSSGNANNYNLSYSAGNLSVTKAALTITIKDTSKVYGDANPTAFAYKVTGLKYSDKMGSVTYSTTATQSSTVGIYDVTPSGATLSVGVNNYTLNYVKGNLSITKAPLTVMADNSSKVYGSKNPAFAYSTTGLKLADSIASVSYTCNADSASKVGSYDIVPSNAKFKTTVADNYAVTYANGNLSVTQAPLTIKADDKTKTYFSAVNPSFTASYSGFVNGETVSVLSDQPVVSCSAVKTSKAGTYPITFSGAKAENYAITYHPGNLTVTESPVQLCLVTVDSETGKNKVIWQRNKGLGIASYKLYRETSTADVYEVLSTIPFAKVGEYVDLTSKPKNQQHRYKISAVDSLGNESVLSHYHQNVFLQYNNSVNGINLSWKPYEIEGGTMEFKSYVLYRGADSTKLDSFQTLSANATVYIDTDPIASSKLMFYRIGGTLKSSCNANTMLKAGGGVYVQAVSNMEDNRLRSSSVDGFIIQMNMAVYPQPATEFINVTYALDRPAQVTFEILNILGESIAKVEAGQVGTELTNNRLDINQFSLQNGIYYLKLKTKYQTGIKKFIVTK